MFLLNLGHRWNLSSSVDEINSVVYLPTGNSSERLSRAAVPEFQRLFFDPQLYLATLNATECPTACSRLSTYPWFFAEIDDFDSNESTRRDWERSVKDEVVECWRGTVPDESERSESARSAVEFQVHLSCTHLILPTPLITEREDEALTTAEWIDAGLESCNSLEVGQPIVATVAIAEGCLHDAAFDAGGFLDTIIDQVTTRDGIDGVYIVIAQTQAKHPFLTDAHVLRAYFRLTTSFRHAGLQVFVNFIGVFGKVCMGAGATGFASGASQTQRRLSLADFEEPGFGFALPKFYSDRVVGEFLTETDLNVVVARRLLRRIRDATPYSQSLIEVLESGGTAADIPEWAESRNNTTGAYQHFVARLAIEAADLQGRSPRQRRTAVRDWLDDAQANALLLHERVGDSISPTLAPSQRWLDLFDEIEP